MPVSAFLALSERWAKEQERVDARVALLAYVSSVGRLKINGVDPRIEDFMPFSSKQEQSADEMLRTMMDMVNNGDGR